jgi:hypothetical protein
MRHIRTEEDKRKRKESKQDRVVSESVVHGLVDGS